MTWLLSRFPILGLIPWKLVLVALACVVIFVFGWKVRGWRDDAHELAAVEKARAQERAAYMQRDSDFKVQQARDYDL